MNGRRRSPGFLFQTLPIPRIFLLGWFFGGVVFGQSGGSEESRPAAYHTVRATPDARPISEVAGNDAKPAGDKVSAAVLAVKRDIEEATDELRRIRQATAEARRPLAERLQGLQAQVAEQRAELKRLRRFEDRLTAEQADLKAESRSLEEQGRYLETLFADYAQAMETRVHAAEGPWLAKKLRPLDDPFRGEGSFDALSEGIIALLEEARDWNHRRWGGHAFDGTALDPDGMAHEGTFFVYGPIAYFAGRDGGPCGPVFTRPGHPLPALGKTFAAGPAAAVRRLQAGEAVVLPVDVTGGDALKIEKAGTTLLERARQGGPVMIPLLAVSFLAFVLAVAKSIDLTRFQVYGDDIVREIMERLRGDDIDGARQRAATLKEPLASLVETVIAYRHVARADLEEILHEKVLATLPRMERHLGLLAVLGGIAPLLGLLGTVTGMIHTFQLVTLFGTGDARLLSGGISEALTTTAFGLMIAIPILLVHALLVRKTRTLVSALEGSAAAMVSDRERRPSP